MIVQLFSVYDRKAAIYLAPFVARSEVDAMRQISASFKDQAMQQTPIGQHPEDFDLYHVGAFDDDIGGITTPNKPRLVVAITALVRGDGVGTVSS